MTQAKMFSFGRFMRDYTYGLPVVAIIYWFFTKNYGFLAAEILLWGWVRFAGGFICELYAPSLNLRYADNGCVIGYKVMDIASDGCMFSPVYVYAWHDGWNKTKVRGRSGFYAFKSHAQAARYASSNCILVRVELAGKIVVCDDGFRAEYARIVCVLPHYAYTLRTQASIHRAGLQWEWE